ncbi:hypothetical protein [Stieleria varia]|uniref:Uncharacterized protein n=1 Tax=Stieleria varia TaxID=2528005 RepID=A0A5C6A0P9_9BACT|nr:hypothetical protein [Stieleria varia]TWT92778.1 hypothetical protein Pla52n_61430 [Stieleria varia]
MTQNSGRRAEWSRRRLRRVFLALLLACPAANLVADTYLNPFFSESAEADQRNDRSKDGTSSSTTEMESAPAVKSAPIAAIRLPAPPATSNVTPPMTQRPAYVHQQVASSDLPAIAASLRPAAAARPIPQRLPTPSQDDRPVFAPIVAASNAMPAVPPNLSRPTYLPPPPPLGLHAEQLGAVVAQPATAPISQPSQRPPASVKTQPDVSQSVSVRQDLIPALPAATPMQPADVTARTKQPEPKSQWLQSVTPSTCRKLALERLDDASREYSVKAWMSAETSAWQSLSYAAQAIDVAQRQLAAPVDSKSASEQLSEAKTAIREARDFGLHSETLDEDGISRLIRSHATSILHEVPLDGMTPSEAADRYLDHARQLLGRMASYHVSTAATLDLLAAIELGRDEADRMPAVTALCLRRAAFQGQPGNGSLAKRLGQQLADMGLDKEAMWTLEHAMNIQPAADTAQALATVMSRSGDREAAMQLTAQLRNDLSPPSESPRVPDIIQLTPEQFASVSPSIHQTSIATPLSNASAMQPQGLPVVPVSYRMNASQAGAGTIAQAPVSPFPVSATGSTTFGTGSVVDGVPSASPYVNSPSAQPHVPDPRFIQSGGFQPAPVSNVQRFLDKVTEMW